MPTQYLLNGEWVSLERFRKDKGIGVEKEVIEIKTELEEPVVIVEPETKEIKEEIKKPTKAKSKNKK